MEHESARKELIELHEKQMTITREEYEKRLADLESTKTAEYEKLKREMQAKIDELLEQLRKERENMQGDAQLMREKMQQEIEHLKK